MKRVVSVLAVAALMAAMLAAMAMPAFASNPQGPYNPYATGTGKATPKENTTTTYKAARADKEADNPPPGGKGYNAKGGETDYTEGVCRGPGC